MNSQLREVTTATELDAPLVAYFHRCRNVWEQAAHRVGEQRHEFSIADRDVTIRLAGDEMTFLTRPFGSSRGGRRSDTAEAPSQSPSRAGTGLEILLWEHAASETELPPPPWSTDAAHPHPSNAWRCDQGEVLINHMPNHGYLIMYHPASNCAVVSIERRERLPFWETSAPFRVLFSWWAEGWGGLVAHAATVGRAGRGLLLVGRGGSGKSTTAIACVEAGMQYVSDDYVLITSDPSPVAHCLYRVGKLHSRLLPQHFPSWQRRVAEVLGDEQKSLFFLAEHFPQQVCERLEIVGIVCPKIADAADSAIEPTSKTDALLALGPSTVYQHPARRGIGLSLMANLIRSLPCYRLQLGPISSGPSALDSLLAHSLAHVD